ncbi:MAG: outer membrane beta-barrel protein, partial [Betaproteobacteria bacterium]
MNRSVIRVTIACAALVAASPAWPAEWAIEPSVESHASVTDNINLQPDTHDSVYSLAISPRVTFARRTETSDIAGKASVTVNRYPGNTELDATDASLALTSKYTAERNTLGLSLGFIRDSTLESELAATGVVQTRHQRNLLTASPTWNYALTDRALLRTSVNFVPR